jgi:hypothetical protein
MAGAGRGNGVSVTPCWKLSLAQVPPLKPPLHSLRGLDHLLPGLLDGQPMTEEDWAWSQEVGTRLWEANQVAG